MNVYEIAEELLKHGTSCMVVFRLAGFSRHRMGDCFGRRRLSQSLTA